MPGDAELRAQDAAVEDAGLGAWGCGAGCLGTQSLVLGDTELRDAELGAWGCRAERSGAVPAGTAVSCGDPAVVPQGSRAARPLVAGDSAFCPARSTHQGPAPSACPHCPWARSLTPCACYRPGPPPCRSSRPRAPSTPVALGPALRCPCQQPCHRRGSRGPWSPMAGLCPSSPTAGLCSSQLAPLQGQGLAMGLLCKGGCQDPPGDAAGHVSGCPAVRGCPAPGCAAAPQHWTVRGRFC